MVGLVVVSHSAALAEGVVELAREMGGEDVAIEPAGGLDDPPGALGTDAERVRAAIERAMGDDGVLVLMDLGSALMSAEMATELLDGGGQVVLSEAPLVEGAVAAAASARGGASLDEVAAEARGALRMKASQLGAEEEAPAVGAGAAEAVPAAPADAEARLPVLNAIGLHARPAARFVEVARRFDADVRVAKSGGGPPVSARSLTALIALGARRGDELVVTAAGPGSAEAVAALEELAREGFGDGLDGAAPGPAVAAPPAAPEPAAEEPAAGARLDGVAASAGVAIGPARHLGAAAGPPPERGAGTPDEERRALDDARARAREAIARDREAVAARGGAQEAAIFDAHAALLDDEAMLEPALAAIDAGATAERAWYDAAEQVAGTYRALDDALLRERAADVLDVGRRVVASLTGQERPALAGPGIVLAGELTPAEAAGLDAQLVRGIATAHGSATAHAAILARALGLPAVVGLGPALQAIPEGTRLLLDGDAGALHVEPAEDLVAQARTRAARARERKAAAVERAHEPGATRDGTRVEVFANLGSADEAARAVEAGAEGVGLLRTEFLFLDRAQLPDEDEQAATLTAIARALDGRPLVVRTLDAGADKPLPALPQAPEANPFLGVRGIRLALARPEVLATQLRAILRVAAEHPVKVMLPMVATRDELRAARTMFEEARAATGVKADVELGIMVEVPAAALMADRLAAEADFFSIGTNDLTQYTMAAERGSAPLAKLLAGVQPAVLALVDATVRAATAHGRWVGVCGELAGDPAAAVLFAGLGVTELSMAPTLIPEAKAALRAVTIEDARAAAAAALRAPDAEAARALATELL
jgi:multiphosphoryl transfer protein